MTSKEIEQSVVKIQALVECGFTEMGDTVVLLGDCVTLGLWQAPNHLSTSAESFPLWKSQDIPVSIKNDKIEFKFAVLKANGELLWEDCENRKIAISSEDGRIITLTRWGDGEMAVVRSKT